MLDNWRLPMLPQAEFCEIDPCIGHVNFHGSFVGDKHFPVPEHKKPTSKYQ